MPHLSPLCLYPPPPPCMLTLVVKVTSLGVELFLPLAVVGLAVRECDLGWGGTCV